VTTRSCPSQPDVSILPHRYIPCQVYNVPIFPAPYTAPARTVHSTYLYALTHPCARTRLCVCLCVGVRVYVRLCMGVGAYLPVGLADYNYDQVMHVAYL